MAARPNLGFKRLADISGAIEEPVLFCSSFTSPNLHRDILDQGVDEPGSNRPHAMSDTIYQHVVTNADNGYDG